MIEKPPAGSFFDRLSHTRTALLLAGIAVVAFVIRVFVSYRSVLGQEYVAFIENDAWYHMRLVDGLIKQFPFRIWHDAYQVHPGGDFANAGPMFDWIVAVVALVLGMGSPSERLVDLVGAFAPPVIGALTILPVYALGKDLFSKRAGIMAAVSIGVMPGDIMVRSLLGFTDHHCAEVLFSTLTLMLMVRALDQSRPGAHRIKYVWATGLTLGVYLLTWAPGAMLVAAVTVWAGLEMFWARVRSQTGEAFVKLLVPAFAIAALMISPWATTDSSFPYALLALLGALAGLLGLYALGRFTLGRPRGIQIYLGALGGTLALTLLAMAFVSTVSLAELRFALARMSPLRAGGGVTEAMPLMRSPDWRPFPLWNQFTTSLIFSIIAAPFVVIRDARNVAVRLVLAWGLFSLFATFGQIRFTYYLAVPVALLAGRGCDLLMSRLKMSRAVLESAVAAALALALAAPDVPALARQSTATTTLTADWFDALQWMRSNTPEPFDDADAYFRDGLPDSPGYGVMGWWDYGYWIARIARRPPATNPRQTQVAEVARFFVSSDIDAAHGLLKQTDSRYIIVDSSMQISMSRSPDDAAFFSYITTTAGSTPTTYCEPFIPPASGDAEPLLYCFPEYYKSMAIRLYAFGGQAVTPRTVWVIDIEPSSDGGPRRIRREMVFTSYEAAMQFVQLRPGGQRLIASKDLLSSPVPLEAIPDVARVYRSVGTQRTGGPSLVQIFENRRR